MKLTNREKGLLLVFLLLLVSILFYRLIYVPQGQRIVALKKEKTALHQQSVEVQNDLAYHPQVTEAYETTRRELTAQLEQFERILRQEDVLTTLAAMAEAANVSYQEMTFGPIVHTAPAALGLGEIPEPIEGNGACMDVTVIVEGDNHALIQFAETIVRWPKYTGLLKYSIQRQTNDLNGPPFQGIFTLRFFAVSEEQD